MKTSTIKGFYADISKIVTDVNYLKTNDNTPVGTIIWSTNAVIPVGYLLCNGSLISRTDYKELFDVIGETFGSGDGATTFALPNLIGKFIEGSDEAGEVKEAGLPNITGTIGRVDLGSGTDLGALYSDNPVGGSNTRRNDGSAAQKSINFNASLSNPIYGNSDTVQPPSVTALPCIKAFSYVLGDATVKQIVNLVANKLSLDGSNLTSAFAGVLNSKNIKTVVETWSSGTEWYRVWSDEWIEQGGFIDIGSRDNGTAVKSFNKPFSNTNYTITLAFKTTGAGYNASFVATYLAAQQVSSSSFTYQTHTASGLTRSWYACGF